MKQHGAKEIAEIRKQDYLQDILDHVLDQDYYYLQDVLDDFGEGASL